MKTKSIEIDTETNSLIEAYRLDFSETHNAIIKRALLINAKEAPKMIAGLPEAPHAIKPTQKRHRASGEYGFKFRGKSYTEHSLKQAYISCLRALQASNPGFFSRLSQEETRARRIVSERPENLYKNSPELAAQHAEKLDGNWYVDVNLSEPQVIQRLKIACSVADIEFGRDLVVEFD